MSDNVMALSRESDARRREIEVRIEAHRDAAAGNLLEVGRWLNAAKDEGVVPHGEWTAWVAEHAALGERTAQLWMQAARELPEGSSLAALGTAKLRSLMSLPAGERETFAEQIGADKLTSREVDAQVKAARAERDEALRLVGEQKKQLHDQLKQARIGRANFEEIMRKQVDDIRKDVVKKQEEIDRLNSVIQSDDIGKKRTARLLDESRAREERMRVEAAELRAALEAERAKPASGPDPEQVQRIALLETQLRSRDQAIRDREREIDRLSEALDEAQTAAMRTGMTGGSERTSPVTLILSAIGALMTQAGRAPAELARMQGLDDETRHLLAGQARMTGQWAMQVLAALREGEENA